MLLCLLHREKKQQKEAEQTNDKDNVPDVTDVESMIVHPELAPQDISTKPEADVPNVLTNPAPCTDFVAEELSKIIKQLSVMNADMTDEEHADAMAMLIEWRDEAR